MRQLRVTVAVFVGVIAAACGTSGGSPGAAPDSGAGSEAGALEAGTGIDAADTGPQNGQVPTIAMPRISAGVPAFASSTDSGNDPASNANDGNPQTSWVSASLPAWIAYDLSSVPAAQRKSALVVWNAMRIEDYISTAPRSGALMPTDFTIEINSAPGGASAAPTDGWVQVVAVTNNLRSTVQSPVDLGGANWVRMSITAASDPQVALELDVYSTPNGYTDSWLFMGDSITFISLPFAFSDLSQLVHQAKADRWPAVIDAGIGGTNTTTAASVIDDTISGFPGRYVVLAYGTNDHANTFAMEPLVEKVIAAGKIPVIPHMPWSALQNIQTDGPLINQAIDALYAKYPQIVHGPDLWAAFLNRTDLIPASDVHPNQAGQEYLRQQWATVMAAIP